MADFNINDNQAKKIMNKARQKGLDVDSMQKAAESGNLDSFLNNNLSEQAAKKLKGILSDENKTAQILNSKEAQELIKKLTEGK